MAETILFEISPVSEGFDEVYDVLWYQSTDGELWDTTPIDTILFSSLTIDTDTGKYIWASSLADETKYHQIRTRTLEGVESVDYIVLPPLLTVKPLAKESSVVATKLETGVDIYQVGDTVELMLDINDATADIIGNTIDIEILDFFNNPISTITANRIVDSLYLAEYVIPLNLDVLYNPFKQNYSLDFYLLKDRWTMPDGTGLEFSFSVSLAKKEQPVTKNSIFKLTIGNIEAVDTSFSDTAEIRFTTLLDPCYCSVEDVVGVYSEKLEDLDVIDLAMDIVNSSKYIDLYMTPNSIVYVDAFNEACKNYAALSVAHSKLNSILNTTTELKQLDTLQIQKQYGDVKRYLDKIEEDMRFYANIIYAGGLDTPFKNRTFIKGVYDPNRVNIPRFNLDSSSYLPYVNVTTSNTTIDYDGNTLEVRGTRTIGYSDKRLSSINFTEGEYIND